MNSQFTAEEIRKGISEGSIQLFPKTNGVSECWKYFSKSKKDDKILFGWAVCKSCFTSILYKAKNGDYSKFYGTKNLSDHLKNCRRTSSPSINNYFKSKQGNIKIQQLDKNSMKENLLKMVVCDGTSWFTSWQLIWLRGSKVSNLSKIYVIEPHFWIKFGRLS